MKITQKDKDGVGRFLASMGEDNIGEMVYHSESPAVMVIEHTEVKSSERGNNVGLQLLDFAVDYARKNEFKIRPRCEFVKVMFQKHSDMYNDVIVKQDL